ncbi:hypothetical protein F5Y14DRAFT_409488, partial [Nemania sp. NC0429]
MYVCTFPTNHVCLPIYLSIVSVPPSVCIGRLYEANGECLFIYLFIFSYSFDVPIPVTSS